MVSVESVLRNHSKKVRKHKETILADAHPNNRISYGCIGDRNLARHCVKASISSVLDA